MSESTAISAPSPLGRSDTATRAFLLAAVLLTAVRVMGLMSTPLGLHPDEAQYWAWSRSLDWGYFSKPPLVAWAIALTTGLAGNETWAVRLAAPFAHTAAATMLFLLGRRMYGPAAGFWAGVGWLLIPGVWLSSMLITTDALLLPLWAAGLYCAWRWIESRTVGWALATGAIIGLGALAKYVMLYYPLCLALAALWSPVVRRELLTWRAAAALATAALVLSPNIAWNAAHKFETVSHTAANANWGGKLFNPGEALAFLGDQVAIAGVLAAGLAGIFVEAVRRRPDPDLRQRFLLAFIIPPLAVILAQAVISRAHGNWAASAYPAVLVLVAGRFAGDSRLRWATILHGALYAVFFALMLSPASAMRAPLIGRPVENGLKRMAAWDRTADIVAQAAREAALKGAPYSAILVDHRHLYNEFAYQFRDAGDLPPLRMYVLRESAGNEAEATAPMTADLGARVLVVHLSPHYEKFVAGDFRSFRTLERVHVGLGPRKQRDLILSEASGFAPVARTPEFLARVGD